MRSAANGLTELASNRTGTFQIFKMNADGTGVTQVTHGAEAHRAAWGSHA